MARLAGLEGLARSLLTGVVPLAALAVLGSEFAVSVAYAAASAFTLFTTLNVARMERVVPRRWILTGGVLGFMLACAGFSWGSALVFVLALALQSAHASLFAVCISLYVMEYIRKVDLVKVEGKRFLYLAVAWLIGPTGGVWLWSNVGSLAPFLIAAALAGLIIVYHWVLRFGSNPVLLAPNDRLAGPLATIPRFFRQRRLRFAYLITCLRSLFWATAFVYGPLYVVDAGLPPWAAGAFLSIASSVLFLSPLVQRLANRYGVRAVVGRAFLLMAFSMASLGVIGPSRPIGVLFWLLGAAGGGAIDVLGNIPFMRMVRPRERVEMAAVFSTWREVSFVAAPALAALVLTAGPIWWLWWVVSGLMMVGVSATSFLPRRL